VIPTAAVALSWSGGKDSALALWVLARDHGVVPRALITTVTEVYDRISMHGVRRSLLALQAAQTGVPLVEVEIPVACPNEVYEQRMAAALGSEPLRDVDAVAFGDLFLEDIRTYREDRLAIAAKRGCFPLWRRDTADLARELSPPASRRSWRASMRASSTLHSPGAGSTTSCSMIYRRASIPAARTASSTRSCMPDRSFERRSPSRSARSSSATGSCSVT
jgi:hypothetical protein